MRAKFGSDPTAGSKNLSFKFISTPVDVGHQKFMICPVHRDNIENLLKQLFEQPRLDKLECLAKIAQAERLITNCRLQYLQKVTEISPSIFYILHI